MTRFLSASIIALGAMTILTGCKTNAFVGQWELDEVPKAFEGDIKTGILILDEDKFALASITSDDGEGYAAQGTWERSTARRIDLYFEIDGDSIAGIGWLNPDGSMTLTGMEEDGDGEAITVTLYKTND